MMSFVSLSLWCHFQNKERWVDKRGGDATKPKRREGNPATSGALSLGTENGARTPKRRKEKPHASTYGSVQWHLNEYTLEKDAAYFFVGILLQEHLTNRQLQRATNEQKQKMEEEQRKLYLSAKQKMIKLRRDKEKEILRSGLSHTFVIGARLD